MTTAPAGSWIEMDGVVHVVGSDCCDDGERCPRCGHSPWHRTGTYFGLAIACEHCDAKDFRPAPAPTAATEVV